MRFNRKIIQNIFETALWDHLITRVQRDIQVQLSLEFFDDPVSSVSLDSISSVEIYDYHVKEVKDEAIVSGFMFVSANTSVYTMDETNKERLWDSGVTEMYYDFSFHEREGKYSKFELDWMDDIHDIWL